MEPIELIDKRAVIDAILNVSDPDIYDTENPPATLFNRLLNAVNSVEAIEKRPRAKWKVASFWTICDNCGHEASAKRLTKYCPHCGALMED